MANNKTATDKIHSQVNPYFKTRSNPNWKALIEAIGESDQEVANLIEEVRKQFFVKTASRPYLDRLGAQVKVSRPRVVGMDDTTMRKYIPVLAYQPKQVKQTIDKLLDLFFFHEATTAFIESNGDAPFSLEDGWEVWFKIDGIQEEIIKFQEQDFIDISAATADEVIAAFNRQAKYSFAILFDDRWTKKKKIRIFTRTVGAKGSIEAFGGRANIALKFTGFIDDAGSGADTVWTISKVGDVATISYISGSYPGLSNVQAGDVIIVDLPDNEGSFIIESVDLSNQQLSFVNLFATPGTFDHSMIPNSYVKFMRPTKSIVYARNNRAVVWEVNPGEIIIEMPATPPVVRRKLIGSAHVNGMISVMTKRISDTSIELSDASEWPSSGKFILEPQHQVDCHIVTPSLDEIDSTVINGRLSVEDFSFSYTSKTGNILSGISPSLPIQHGVIEVGISTLSRSSDIVTVDTVTAHNLSENTNISIYDTIIGSNFNGTWCVREVLSPTSFTYGSTGIDESAIGGELRFERVGLSDVGSRAFLTSTNYDSGMIGPYLWDTNAPFIISSYTAKTNIHINAGTLTMNLAIQTPNNIPNQQGYLIFDYGLETQEGPIRYLYKVSDGSIAIDPSYVFQYEHPVGSSITVLRRRGAHIMSGLGKEVAFYVCDPAIARNILQDIVNDIKSAGIFLRYLIRYPELYYATLDVYSSGNDPG